jgi:hypothetical protein
MHTIEDVIGLEWCHQSEELTIELYCGTMRRHQTNIPALWLGTLQRRDSGIITM